MIRSTRCIEQNFTASYILRVLNRFNDRGLVLFTARVFPFCPGELGRDQKVAGLSKLPDTCADFGNSRSFPLPLKMPN
jgi:hypothetical protein